MSSSSGKYDLTNRSAENIKLRAEAMNQWYSSDTAKAPSIRHPHQYKISFEYGPQLLAAVASHDFEETLRLIKEGADVNYANTDGLTSLHQACIDDNFDMVKLLVENGACINASDSEGWTSLHAAASRSISMDIIKYLVSKGADVAAVNADAELPVDLTEDDQIIQYLTEEMDKRGVDIHEVRASEEQAMREDATKWIQSGKIEDIHDKKGVTPLHVAASKGYVEVAKMLLKSGANPNVQDCDGWTPLHAAAYWNHPEIIKLLVQNGAKLNTFNHNYETPMSVADEDVVDLLKKLAKEYKAQAEKEPLENSLLVPKKDVKVIGILKPYQAEVVEITPIAVKTPVVSKPGKVVLGPPKRVSSPSTSTPPKPEPEEKKTTPPTAATPQISKPRLPPSHKPTTEEPPKVAPTSTTISRPPSFSKTAIPTPSKIPLSTKPISLPPRVQADTTSSSTTTSKSPETETSTKSDDSSFDIMNELKELRKRLQKYENETATLRKEREDLLKTIDTLKSSDSDKKSDTSSPSKPPSSVSKVSRPPPRK